jgi:PPK2 family polyphosphate:nucleotide phosphotransferase
MGKIKLSDIDTRSPKDINKEEIKKITAEIVEKIGKLQDVLYASHTRSLLVIIQGMDASGKDGAIRDVFAGVNPMGIRVISFKKPTTEELDHDFLWRIHKNVPPKGMIHVFNRSHYEDVLIVRVHKWVDEKTIQKRFDFINSFEELLQERGTAILKFYLHISQKEQQKRFIERQTMPNKMWKFNQQDLEEAKYWPEYIKCYEEVFEKCNFIPWNIVPSDHNFYKEYLIAKKVLKTLEEMNLSYPPPNF